MGARATVEAISSARCVADYALALGAREYGSRATRIVSNHYGAVLADTVLQAGLSYRSVVKPRVQRIVDEFPNARDLAGVVEIVEADLVSHFLLWTHTEKVSRFINLVRVLRRHDIEDVQQLAEWIQVPGKRKILLSVRGIGPKSVDYLSCLAGVDCIAVDRHVRDFASQAGINIADYELLKLVVSYAADFLEMRRRDFDAWIWSRMAV